MKTIVILLLSAFLAHAKDEKDSRPNILWIFVEDLSPYLGCYGDPVNKDHTPAIDRLAEEGIIFKRTYMPAPVCSACRSAIITGIMQTTTGAHQHRSSRHEGIVPPELRIQLPKGVKTIPELIRNAGYFTFNCGKDDYNFHYDRRKLYTVGTKKDYVAGQNGWQGNVSIDLKDWTTGTWRERKDPTQPWFGQIMLWGGKAKDQHVRKNQRLEDHEVQMPPYYPESPALRKSWATNYNGARGTDAQVEEILKLLKKDGQLEKTIIFFFSDHGNNQSLRHKQFCYEGGVHVPFIMKGPGIKAGTVRNDLISGLDISATTLALTGANLPAYLDGRDLLAKDHQPRRHVIGARDRCDYTIDRIRTVRTEKLRYIRNFFPDRPMLQAQYRDNRPPVLELKRLRKEGKLTQYQEQYWFGKRPTEELYDLTKDPFQISNLAGNPEYSAELKRHRKILNDWIKESSDKGEEPQDVMQLRATYDLWKDKPIFKNAKVNPEYDQFKN